MLEIIPEAVKALIGKPLHHEDSEIVVESGYIYNTCAAVQNGNPLFWDEAVSNSISGGKIAPPTMLSTWFRPHHWRPGSEEECTPLQAHFDLKRWLQLPEAIISDNELRFGEPVRLGDRLHSYQVIRSISDIKQTKLGRGRFWVIDVVYENQDGEYVGTDSYTALGYVRNEG
ncbi:MaoC family dehydratase [Pseudomaricurvus alkylphenolicus]|uniref:FAS1-like dehydratase domain-containing protein n=1 Tax=Pseudomaricurvus alkylphenolicus TaxID=1306991 RepID=UPI001422EDD8|nr:MaoC family dehydratase N-terminal domain-containing protein [Pseudomaricurvus alkylphenolicus]NIB38930.1 MaoC family dehydratase [Pseudomaricurvus alkylphenolicus]